jgi:hypothetical protein
MDIDAGVPLEATPFHKLLDAFKLNNKGITIDELTNIIDKLDPSLQLFEVADDYAEDFRKLVLYELEERVKELFLKITTKIIDKKDPLVNQAIDEWKKDPTNTDHITKIGTFKIDVNFEYIDKMTQSHKLKPVSITYGELLTKYNIFKSAIQSAFAQSSLITSQSEFIQVFFNNAITTLGMRVSTARDLFDTAGVSAQCDAAHKIDWPSSDFPEVPNRFTPTYPEEKKDWKKYCYICGLPINATYGPPSQCEHILPVFQACTFNCLIQVSTDINAASPLRQALYKLEYAGSHACCNILKSNNSFIIIDPTKDPPVSINSKYIVQLITLIITKSKNLSDSLECFKLLKGLPISTPKSTSDFITAQRNEIKDNYLEPLVTGLNMTLKRNESDQTYATSGIISLFLLLNQFISFEPAIEQTIIGILTGGTIIKKSNMLFVSYATATFLIKQLQPIITELEYKGKYVGDSKNYLDFIGFIDDVPSYNELLDRLLTENTATNNITLPRNLSKDSNYKFISIKDLMSHFTVFYINEIFLNINNYDDFSQMINPEHFIQQKYPNNIANNLLELKIKNFFTTLLKQFYPYDATQSSFSAKEKSSLLEFCKAYIGLEFVYIIIYYLHEFHKTLNTQLKVEEQVEFFTREITAKIQICCVKYKQYYMEFVTYFFIYQSIHILNSSNDKSLTLDLTDGAETIQEKKNIIIYHSGETYYDIWILLSQDIEHKDSFTNIISRIKGIVKECETSTKIGFAEELQPITDKVPSIVDELCKLFTQLFNTVPKFKEILTIYHVDTIGSAAFRKKITPLPDKSSIGFVAAMPNAGIDYADAAAMSHSQAGIYNADMHDDSIIKTGGVIPITDPAILKRGLMDMRQSKRDGLIKKVRSDNMKNKRGYTYDDDDDDDDDDMSDATSYNIKYNPQLVNDFIRQLKSINTEIIIQELQTRSSRSETIYELRPAPTPLFQINLDAKISRLVIDDTRGIYICIYSPAYIITSYRCILIDTYFLNKIVEMKENKYVFSNGELLDDTDIELLKMLIDIETSKKNGRAIGSALYNELFNNSKFFTLTQHPEYLPLFEKCNLFLYYDSGDNSVRDIYDNKLYASGGGVIVGGKKYHIKKTKKLKNKKIVKKTKEKLKTKSRKHKPRKHKSRKHKSKLTKTLKKKI